MLCMIDLFKGSTHFDVFKIHKISMSDLIIAIFYTSWIFIGFFTKLSAFTDAIFLPLKFTHKRKILDIRHCLQNTFI